MTIALKPGTILQGDRHKYTIEKILGQGSFGITYLAYTTINVETGLGAFDTTIKVAVKEFFMRDINGREGTAVTSGSQGGLSDKYKAKFAKEAENLNRMSHPNIVKVLEAFEANSTYYYVMEHCEGGSLDSLIASKNGICEPEAIQYFSQIASALQYMHDNKMLHLDLKPANIMLRANGELVLIDFGLSKHYDENGIAESSTTIGGGTPGYAPLEQSNYHEGKEFPVTMDIYALGATLYKMLTGERPADAPIILNEGFSSELLDSKGVSSSTITCIEKAMSPMKKQRYASVGDLCSALNTTGPYINIPERKEYAESASSEETVINEVPIVTQSKEKFNWALGFLVAIPQCLLATFFLYIAINSDVNLFIDITHYSFYEDPDKFILLLLYIVIVTTLIFCFWKRRQVIPYKWWVFSKWSFFVICTLNSLVLLELWYELRIITIHCILSCLLSILLFVLFGVRKTK